MSADKYLQTTYNKTWLFSQQNFLSVLLLSSSNSYKFHLFSLGHHHIIAVEGSEIFTEVYLYCHRRCNLVWFNHFYCPTNALNYTNLEVKIYIV